MDIFMDVFLSNYILLFFLNISCLFWESYPMKYLHGVITEKNLCSIQLHIFFQQNFRRKLRYNFIYMNWIHIYSINFLVSLDFFVKNDIILIGI